MQKDIYAQIAVYTLPVGAMGANCYIVADNDKNALIIDPGDTGEYISDIIERDELRPLQIVATHGHFDHVMAAYFLQKTYDIPFCIHKDDAFLVTRMSESAQHFLGVRIVDPEPEINAFLGVGQMIQVGAIDLLVIHTPGHTPGGICLVDAKKRFMFTGDTIFADGRIGRYDFSYSDQDALMRSVGKIVSMDEMVVLYPGHGKSTTAMKEQVYHFSHK